MSTINTSGEQRTLLSAVSWNTYVALVEESQSTGKHLTFDRGELEIMSPMMPHETAKRLLGRLIEQFTLIRGIALRSSASTTFQRADLERGFEADESYYIQHAATIRGKEQIDLAIDPPPDLVIEIEISRSAINKLDLFASMSIPEVWRYDGRLLHIEVLRDQGYVEAISSSVLPDFPVALAENLLARRAHEDENELIREFVQQVGH